MPHFNQDSLQRFLFDDTAVRGELVQLHQSYQDVLATHDYPESLQLLLGEFLAAAALLTATIKIDGILSLEARGKGDVSLIMAECNTGAAADMQLRGLADYSAAPEQTDLNAIFTQGQLIITLDPKEGTRYQGIVSLDQPSLSACLESYFSQSEQLPTKIWLETNAQTCGGLLLQRLPDDEHNKDPDAWDRLTHLAATLTQDELLNLDFNTLLFRLFHEEKVRIFPTQELKFGCTCSKERTSQGLLSLGATELDSILAEQGKITTKCHFCKTSYNFSPEDIEDLRRNTQVPTKPQVH